MIEHWPEAVLEVIMPGARFIERQPTELPQVGRLTDRVMRVEAKGRQVTIRFIKRILESRGIELSGHLDVKLQGAQTAVLEQLADELIFTTDAQAAIRLMTQRLA